MSRLRILLASTLLLGTTGCQMAASNTETERVSPTSAPTTVQSAATTSPTSLATVASPESSPTAIPVTATSTTGPATRTPAEPTRVPTASPAASPTASAPAASSTASAEIPSGWATYTNADFGITLQYPADWRPIPGYEDKYGGEDGFFQLTAVGGADVTIDAVAEGEAHHEMQPYGSQPTVDLLTLQGQEARLILPSADQATEWEEQAGVIVRAPQPIQIAGTAYSYVLLWADQQHIRQIAETVRFIQASEGESRTRSAEIDSALPPRL